MNSLKPADVCKHLHAVKNEVLSMGIDAPVAYWEEKYPKTFSALADKAGFVVSFCLMAGMMAGAFASLPFTPLWERPPGKFRRSERVQWDEKPYRLSPAKAAPSVRLIKRHYS